jgi:hypothetical protein
MQEETVNPYYQSFIEEVDGLMEKGEYDQALVMVQQELALPYVPQNVMKFLEKCRKECLSHTQRVRSRNPEQLDVWIAGTPVQKEMAVSLLCTLNLRQYLPQVQTLLLSDVLDEFKGELIEALMEQKVDEPLKIVKQGMEITFVPSVIVPASEDATLKAANRYFDAWLDQDPSMCAFCQRLLEQETLLVRPFDFQDLDPLPLAKAIVRLVFEAMGQKQDLDSFYKERKLQNTEDYVLTIEMQGDNR